MAAFTYKTGFMVKVTLGCRVDEEREAGRARK